MSDSPPHQPFPPDRFWTAVGQWLDSLGATPPGPPEDAPAGASEEHWSAVEHVCPHCPICQGAALFDRVDWRTLSDVALAAANLLSGVAGALLEPDAHAPEESAEEQ